MGLAPRDRQVCPVLLDPRGLPGSDRLLDRRGRYRDAMKFHGVLLWHWNEFRPDALSRVISRTVHDLGGDHMAGHNGRVAGPAWPLPERTCPRATGILCEVIKRFAKRPGPDANPRGSLWARDIWRRYHPNREAVA